MKRFTKVAATALSMLSFAAVAWAAEATMPFPQFKVKPILEGSHLTAPAGQTTMFDVIEKQYLRYKKYVKRSTTVTGGYYVEALATDGNPNTLTVSEAHGYGMLIMALMAGYEPEAKTIFDGLVKFYEAKKIDYGNKNLMAWKIGANEEPLLDWYSAGVGSATDGDLDIAYALLLGSKQWDDASYAAKAKLMINDIKQYDMNPNSKLTRLGPWAATGRYSEATRPSDWMAGHMRSFKKASGDAWWDAAAGQIYNAYFDFVGTHTSTGAITSDFINNGSPAQPWPNGDAFLETVKYDGTYYINASRVPFRFASDYATSQDSDAKKALGKWVDWAIKTSEGDPSKIFYGYDLDGKTSKEGTVSSIFVAPLVAAATSDEKYKDFLVSGWNELQKPYMTDNNTVYEDALLLLNFLVMTGNWWGMDEANTWIDVNGAPDIVEGSIYLDHFGNTYGDGNAQTNVGAITGVNWGDTKYGDKGGDTTYYHGGGYWHTYNSGGKLYSPSGTEISNREITVGEEKMNAMELLAENNVMGVNFKVDAEDEKMYGYVALSVPFFSKVIEADGKMESEAQWVDLSKESMSLVIKCRGTGTGQLSVKFSTEDVKAVEPDKSGWVGAYVATVPIKEGWRYVTITADDIKPEPWSPLETASKESDQIGWKQSGSQKVKDFTFNVSEKDDDGADLNLWVEEIILNGITYSDWGLNDRPATSIAKKSGQQSLKDLNWSASMNSQGIAINFNSLRQDNVKASLYTPAGREIATTTTRALVGSNSINFSGASMGTGIYLLRLEGSDMVRTGKVSFIK